MPYNGSLELAAVGSSAIVAALGLATWYNARKDAKNPTLSADVQYLLTKAQELHLKQAGKSLADTSDALPLSAVLSALEESRMALGTKNTSAEHITNKGASDAALTKKELEETMRTMLAPPGAGGFGGPDGESALDRFTRDLTLAARQGKLDPVICRDEEIRRCVHILSRRTKNNPVLIGETGVGKTATVEGLAQRIVAGDVPVSLMGVKILDLDLGSLTAGCMMPGEFEERLKAVLTEMAAMKNRAILFIDDIHNLVPAMGAQGATMMDGGSLLKPALSRVELRCIGATSIDKFKKTIEKDPALERRFQQVFIDQPTVPATISILRGLRERYEGYHGVGISEAALMAAASLAARYISGRFLPDKAIDLMDEATAQVKMEQTLKPEVLDVVERRIGQLEMEAKSLKPKAAKERAAEHCLAEVEAQLTALRAQRLELATANALANEVPVNTESRGKYVSQMMQLSRDIEQLTDEADVADDEGELESATEMRGRISQLHEELAEAQTKMIQCPFEPPTFMINHRKAEVSEGDVAKVVSRWTGIPITKLVASEREKLLHLQDELHNRIIGQEEAVGAVAEAIQRSRADLADPNGPIASFMFLGPTGVGKTELAKALAAYLFNSEEAIVRLDMSEYMEKHAVSRLIGAPPGYVGYDEGGLLTDAVKRRPYSVVLFDEIEKAHVDVFNVLLQVLDDGRVTDAQGHTVSFKNTLIIMTSNLGSAEIFTQASAEEEDRGAVKERVMEHVRTHFRPEFINRIDDFITFQPLKRDQITQIVKLRAKRLVDRMSEKRMRLELQECAVEYLASVGYDPVYGARPVKRALQRELQTLLAQALLRNDFEEEDTVVVKADSSGVGLVLMKGPKIATKAEAAAAAITLTGGESNAELAMNGHEQPALEGPALHPSKAEANGDVEASNGH
ncbi:hypothetical protein CEUSTIGMA_g120.t1 [Chlamydomonas eustigma]|uniref:Clp R domain-containing protein n=1 Tax=Chlamydomonas eustigma TaxID=1157962 RepID=A0A250WP92_9CHLO|nr:hypothetical protein CEUSTIGMA_g120.t1 [Chlamydomonas eustigma]|eukprot:GAX72664.1 hypothetical protein CEUSTIGMA_g120.t1 [Chlamydomonas eustigma]